MWKWSAPLGAWLGKKAILEAMPTDDVVNKQRFILFRMFSLSGALVCVGTSSKMLATIPNPGLLPFAIIALSVVMLVNYFTVKRTNKLHQAYWVLMIAAFALLHLVAYSCGGIRTGGLLYHGVIILYAFLLLGKKGGRAFSVMFGVQAIYFYLISRYTDWTSFDMFKNEVELINQDFLVNALFSFYLIASQGNYLQSGKNIIIQSLEKSKAELEAKNKELELSNERLNEYTRNLEKSNRELDKFASVASHDLKAPLRAIGTLSDFIGDDLKEQLSGESKSHLATIKGCVRRMESLLDALLLYSKSDRKHLQYARVNTAAVLEKVVASLRTTRNYKLSISDHMPVLLADEQVLSSVFSNLLDNAIKFNDKPVAEISISARETTHDWVFSITDNGPGIDARYHDKIFVIFQTIHPRDEFESIGAGLAITRKIIENKGGRIDVISTPGEGATFSFSLPKGIPKKSVSDDRQNQELTFADLN